MDKIANFIKKMFIGLSIFIGIIFFMLILLMIEDVSQQEIKSYKENHVEEIVSGKIHNINYSTWFSLRQREDVKVTISIPNTQFSKIFYSRSDFVGSNDVYEYIKSKGLKEGDNINVIVDKNIHSNEMKIKEIVKD